MLKIMDRSLWYYIKRPNFAVSLFYSSSSTRTYSLFVMDLIEADMVEYDPAGYPEWKIGYSEWKIKGTPSWIDNNLTNSYVDSILKQKYRKILNEKQKRKVEEKIATHLEALKGENT